MEAFFSAEAIELENGKGVRRGSHPVLMDVQGLCSAGLSGAAPPAVPRPDLRGILAGVAVPTALSSCPLCGRLFPLIPQLAA